MFIAHDLIAQHGVAGARKLVQSKVELKCVEVAAAFKSKPRGEVIYGGPAALCSPHRLLGDSAAIEEYTRRIGAFAYRLESGIDSEQRRHGLPFGPKARLFLLGIYNRMLRHKSRTFRRSTSKRASVQGVGLNVGGNTYRAWDEQRERILYCSIGITPTGSHNKPVMHKLVESSVPVTDETGSFFRVTINEHFFRHAIEESTILDLSAVKMISNHCWALDVYIWLNCFLPRLEEPMAVDWDSFASLLDLTYTRQMKSNLQSALQLALAVYPTAQVEFQDDRIIFRPTIPLPLTPLADAP